MRLDEWIEQSERRLAPGVGMLSMALAHLRPDLEIQANVVDLRQDTDGEVKSRAFWVLTESHLIHGATLRRPATKTTSGHTPESFELTSKSYPLKCIEQVRSNLKMPHGEGLITTFAFTKQSGFDALDFPQAGAREDTQREYQNFVKAIVRRLI